METFVGISAWPGIKLFKKKERTLNQTNNPHCSSVYSSIKHIERLFDFVGVCSAVESAFCSLYSQTFSAIHQYGSKQETFKLLE